MPRKKSEIIAEEVKRLESVSFPKPNKKLDGAMGDMRSGRFIERQYSLRKQIHAISEEMIEIVADLARNSTSDFCRLAAANSLLDRDIGKAVQFTEQTMREERVIKIETLTPEIRQNMVDILDVLDPQRKISDGKTQ